MPITIIIKKEIVRRFFSPTQNNIMESCKKCGEYTDYDYQYHGWCKPCQIDNLKGNFTNWTSGNEKIDNFIQEMQLKINQWNDIVIEWIPYNQFSDIKKIGVGGFATVYSAIWADIPLDVKRKQRRLKKIALKCLHNSQGITNEFVNEV